MPAFLSLLSLHELQQQRDDFLDPAKKRITTEQHRQTLEKIAKLVKGFRDLCLVSAVQGSKEVIINNHEVLYNRLNSTTDSKSETLFSCVQRNP